MNYPFLVFVKATGEILRTGSVSEPFDLPLQNQEACEDWLMETADDRFQYVLDGQIVDRPLLHTPERVNLAVGQTYHDQTMPEGSRVSLDRGPWMITDMDGVEFTPAVPGYHELAIEGPFPLQPHIVRITVRG